MVIYQVMLFVFLRKISKQLIYHPTDSCVWAHLPDGFLIATHVKFYPFCILQTNSQFSGDLVQNNGYLPGYAGGFLGKNKQLIYHPTDSCVWAHLPDGFLITTLVKFYPFCILQQTVNSQGI